MFVHTDKNGISVKCAECMQTIENTPAVKICNSFKEQDVDGPWQKTWSIVYTYYCERCAIKVLKKRRKSWLRFLIQWVFGGFLKNTK